MRLFQPPWSLVRWRLGRPLSGGRIEDGDVLRVQRRVQYDAPVADNNQRMRSHPFDSEEELVLSFLSALESSEDGPLSADAVIREFDYKRGRTDVVSISDSGEIVAFEAKLTHWRGALTQAYRNTCFAHRSFVVLPWHTAQLASRFSGEFQRRGVGLCAMQDGRVTVLHNAVHREPIEPWLSELASAAARRADS